MPAASSVPAHRYNLLVQGLSDQARLLNASGATSAGDPYIRVFLPNGVLMPGESIVEKLVFKRKPFAGELHYTLQFLSGQGTP